MRRRDILNEDAVMRVRTEMNKKDFIYFVNPDSLVIDSSWFYKKDGTPMNMEEKMKRLSAIERLVRIRLMERIYHESNSVWKE